MTHEEDMEVDEIITRTECPKGFECRNLAYDQICKAKDIGIESFLECLEEDSRDCPFTLPFGNSFLCQCPLRVYLAKRFGE